jgi:hypothetical protein
LCKAGSNKNKSVIGISQNNKLSSGEICFLGGYAKALLAAKDFYLFWVAEGQKIHLT